LLSQEVDWEDWDLIAAFLPDMPRATVSSHDRETCYTASRES
jgi:hypothetical protein